MGRGASMGSAWPGRMAAPRRGNRARRRRACSQPRATPWVAGGFPCAPRRGKSHGRCASVTAFAPFGGVPAALLPTRGDASFGRSTPGWELATPSGFCLERWSSKNRASRGDRYASGGRIAGCSSAARRGGRRALCQLFPFLPTIWVTCSTEMTEYLFQPTCGSTFS